MQPPHRVMPTLRITDYERSKAFYVDGLGFKIDWEHRFKPNFPVFMQVSRDGMAFYLTQHTGDCPAGALLHLYVPDVDAWYVELQSRGVTVQDAPSQSVQGLRDMTVFDPDDNKIRICTRLPDWKR